MPVAIAFAFILAMASGVRSGWRTQADVADEAQKEAERKARAAAAGAPPPPQLPIAMVQGAGDARRWFYWFIYYRGTTATFGPVQMTEYEAFQMEFRTKSNYLGAVLSRYVWFHDARGSAWVKDSRTDQQFLAGAPVPSPFPGRQVTTDVARTSSSRVGAVPLDGGPVRGDWPYRGLPEEVKLAGRVFQRAKFSLPYPGVRAQYREARARDSAHLFVLDTGRFVVPHIDDANPDRGLMLEHGLRDLLPSVLPPV